MTALHISIIGNKEGIYIDPKDCNAYVDYEKAINFKNVNMLGVNHLVIDRSRNGHMKIVMATGYWFSRGMFTDNY